MLIHDFREPPSTLDMDESKNLHINLPDLQDSTGTHGTWIQLNSQNGTLDMV